VERTALWPDATDAWVIHDDGVLLAVDKPSWVSSQAADATRPDDVVTRLRAYLARGRGEGAREEREQGEPVYLGVHQRLDQATSGVMVFARRKEANARLAAQFEGRGVEKTSRRRTWRA
jgi:23S rRNA (cytosine1962-C5)-methyltransferase